MVNPTILQLVHVMKRLSGKDKKAISMHSNFDKKFSKQTILKIKSYQPITQVPTNLKVWFEHQNIDITNKRKGNSKYDCVIPGDYLENSINFFEKFEQVHNCCCQDGFIVLDLPLSVNAGWFSYQPNLFKQLAEQNEYEVSYFKLMDHSATFPVVLDSDKTLSNSYLSDILYKYGNTIGMRINVTFKKVNNNTFVFKDQK